MPILGLQVAPNAAAVTHVVPAVTYTGAYPVAPLTDATAAPFLVELIVHTRAQRATTALLTASGEWDPAHPVALTVAVPAGEATASIKLTAHGVKLWWPNGHGEQPLYNVSVTLTFPADATAAEAGDPGAGAVVVAGTARRIGFRYAVLVTGNDTDPAYVAAAATTDGSSVRGMMNTFFFRVNGAAVYAKGANMVPMEEMEGRANADALRYLVRNAASAGFTILRNWGGGIFQYDAWYDALDELGIMCYQDLMYAQGGHGPAYADVTQAAEIAHQVRRLSHHPSLVVYTSCNECGFHGNMTIYINFAMEVRCPWLGLDFEHSFWVVLSTNGVPCSFSTAGACWLGRCNALLTARVAGFRWWPPRTKPRRSGPRAPALAGSPASTGSPVTRHSVRWQSVATASTSTGPTSKAALPHLIRSTDATATARAILSPPSAYRCSSTSPYTHPGGARAPSEWGCREPCSASTGSRSCPRSSPCRIVDLGLLFDRCCGRLHAWARALLGAPASVSCANHFVFNRYVICGGGRWCGLLDACRATLSPENWGINQPVWASRNYPCDNFIHAFFGKEHSNVSAVGAAALQVCNLAASSLPPPSPHSPTRPKGAFGGRHKGFPPRTPTGSIPVAQQQR